MTTSDDQEQTREVVAFPERRGPREHLTEAQRIVLAALAAGYSVCMSRNVQVRHYEQVLLGNGSRLAAVTVDSLHWRGLIEQAEILLEPQLPPDYPEHWRKHVVVFQLTEAGRQVVLRQRLHFEPQEVVTSLPSRVEVLRETMERYRLTYGCEPEVALRGVLPSERFGWQVTLKTWRRVVAYNEANNLLGLVGGASGEDEAALLWVRPQAHSWDLTSSVRVRLRPLPSSTHEPHRGKRKNRSVNDE